MEQMQFPEMSEAGNLLANRAGGAVQKFIATPGANVTEAVVVLGGCLTHILSHLEKQDADRLLHLFIITATDAMGEFNAG